MSAASRDRQAAHLIEGVKSAMATTATKFVDSLALKTARGALVLFGIPIMLTLLYSISGRFLNMEQVNAVQAAEQARIVQEVNDLQAYRREAFARGAAVQRDVSAIKDMIVDQKLTIQRLSDRIDQGQRRAP